MSADYTRSSVPMFVAWILLAIAAGGVTVAATVLPFAVVGLSTVAVMLIALNITSLRIAWLPVLVYWTFSSFAPDLIAVSVHIGGVPVTLQDALVLSMGATGVVHLANRALPCRPGRITVLIVTIFFSYAAFAAGRGLSSGFYVYSVSIDLRNFVYMAVGAVAGYVIWSDSKAPRLIYIMLWMSLFGFSVQEVASLARSLTGYQLQGTTFEDLRSIDVPFFIGKYGIILCAYKVLTNGVRRHIVTTIWLIGGIALTTATLIRTAWLATGASLIVLAASNWSRHAFRSAVSLLILLGLLSVVASVTPLGSGVIGAVRQRTLAAVSPEAIYQAQSVGSSAEVNYDTVGARIDESRQALSYLNSPVDWIFGVGLGLSVAQDQLHPTQHNSFVWVVSKMGLIGLAIFGAGLVATPIIYGLKALKYATGDTRVILSVMIACHVGNVVSGYASGQLTQWTTAPIVGLTASLILALGHRAAERLSTAGADA